MITTVFPLPIFNDNYIWIIYNSQLQEAIAVDTGLAEPLIEYLTTQKLTLTAILITHHHPDHTGGIRQLQSYYDHDIHVYGPTSSGIQGITHPLKGGDQLSFAAFDRTFTLYETPGHTLDHLCYYSASPSPWLFCGDTLFSAGCGRLFEGTPEQMYHSLRQLNDLPSETQIFCTHEYTTANLGFAAQVEPNNLAIRNHQVKVAELREQHKPSLPSSLALERNINPFLRADEVSVQQSVAAHYGQNVKIGLETFAKLRAWKDVS